MKLKELLSSPPVLAYLCFSKPFVLRTDASGQGLGAVLEQEQEDGCLHPITYASRTLSAAESHYGITDLEALGIVWAAKHFRAYLLGHWCTVFTDHAPLRAMLKAQHPSGRLAQWAGVISELELDIQYRPGRKHLHADALPRAPVEKRADEPEFEPDVMQVTADPAVQHDKVVELGTEFVKLQREDQ